MLHDFIGKHDAIGSCVPVHMPVNRQVIRFARVTQYGGVALPAGMKVTQAKNQALGVSWTGAVLDVTVARNRCMSSERATIELGSPYSILRFHEMRKQGHFERVLESSGVWQ